MGITRRQYRSADFKLVSDFLIAHFQPGNQDGNWLQPAWEYMHSHPALDESSLDKIGIWESGGDIVGVAHYESSLGIEDRRKMQSGPNFRADLTIVIGAPTGDFVSFCGMWYEPVNKIAYVEPVATDPDFRRMGLAKAAIWEGIRRCAVLGATVVYVGSDQGF